MSTLRNSSHNTAPHAMPRWVWIPAEVETSSILVCFSRVAPDFPSLRIVEKLSSIVRSVSQNNEAREQQQRSAQNTPTPWDNQTIRDRPRSRESNTRSQQRDSRESQSQRDSKESQRERVERYGSSSRQAHVRNGSAGTQPSSQGDYADGGRPHDYDLQSMETALSSPRASMARNPIPPPQVTVRSEYPTLTRARQSQTLTCLITIEVPEGKWSPDPEDLRGAPPLPSVPQEKEVVRPHSPERNKPRDWASESSEVLEEITEDLRVRVDNWHGLDFSRYVTASMAAHMAY